MHDTYLERLEQAKLLSGQSGPVGEEIAPDEDRYAPSDPIFSKGQSKRIWNELYVGLMASRRCPY
jgi:nuclear GTP-binding protein